MGSNDPTILIEGEAAVASRFSIYTARWGFAAEPLRW